MSDMSSTQITSLLHQHVIVHACVCVCVCGGGGGVIPITKYPPPPYTPHVEDVMMKLKTICCDLHNTFTFSMVDHGLNGHPNKIPTHISLK